MDIIYQRGYWEDRYKQGIAEGDELAEGLSIDCESSSDDREDEVTPARGTTQVARLCRTQTDLYRPESRAVFRALNDRMIEEQDIIQPKTYGMFGKRRSSSFVSEKDGDDQSDDLEPTEKRRRPRQDARRTKRRKEAAQSTKLGLVESTTVEGEYEQIILKGNRLSIIGTVWEVSGESKRYDLTVYS